jgi:hypothetical protein
MAFHTCTNRKSGEYRRSQGVPRERKEFLHFVEAIDKREKDGKHLTGRTANRSPADLAPSWNRVCFRISE